MTMLLKVLVMLEGTGKRLVPDFSLTQILKPYRKKMMARRISPPTSPTLGQRNDLDLVAMGASMGEVGYDLAVGVERRGRSYWCETSKFGGSVGRSG